MSLGEVCVVRRGAGQYRVRSGCAVVRCSTCKRRGVILVDAAGQVVPSKTAATDRGKEVREIAKAVVMLALVLACTGASAPRVVGEDAGAALMRRGRQVDVDAGLRAVGVDAIRVADAIQQGPGPDLAPLVPDAIRAVDGVRPDQGADLAPLAQDAIRVVDAVPWGKRDDAGRTVCPYEYERVVMATQHIDADAVFCYGKDGTVCNRDLSGTLAAPCGLGKQTGYEWSWYVRSCEDCFALAPWTVRP